MAHNKTLAGQLYSELKDFFPNNSVEYFVSYYDYYQPEAYVPHTDTFIEKDAQVLTMKLINYDTRQRLPYLNEMMSLSLRVCHAYTV